MRRTFVVAPVATVLVIAGLYWLMLHGYLELTAWLLVVAVLGDGRRGRVGVPARPPQGPGDPARRARS